MRITSLASVLLAGIALALFMSTGCDKPSGDDHAAHGDHDHDAEHAHDADDHTGHDDDTDSHADHPDHGPFGGHVFKLDTSEFQGEWKKYKDNDVIKMYLLDATGKKAAPLKVDSFIVTSKVGNDDAGFTLEPEEPDAEGATAVYSLDDKDLSIAIPLGVDIEIKVGDKVYKGEIKAHQPLDH